MMSRGASVAMIAATRPDKSSAFSNSRARSSSAGRVRSPFRGPSFTSAGFAPRNCGVEAISRPRTTVKLSERWWPSTRQPQVSRAEGAPKKVK